MLRERGMWAGRLSESPARTGGRAPGRHPVGQGGKIIPRTLPTGASLPICISRTVRMADRTTRGTSRTKMYLTGRGRNIQAPLMKGLRLLSLLLRVFLYYLVGYGF